MFTTATFDEHEFTIDSSAATPWRFAPYPTDVGTATTGMPTNPPTARARAPAAAAGPRAGPGGVPRPR